jgi:hypothetical protein
MYKTHTNQLQAINESSYQLRQPKKKRPMLPPAVDNTAKVSLDPKR